MSIHNPAGNRIGRAPRILLALTATAAMLALAGCSTPAPKPTSDKPRASATPSAEPVVAPTLQPEASAAENLPYFDSIAAAVLAADPAAGGAAFVDALAAGGFVKTDMEVGFDRTSVDLAADSVQWAVRFNGECLIGQFGPASGGYHSIVTPPLSTGSCLIGVTRPIDW